MTKYHILIVDDEINRCKMLEYKISKAGYNVTYTTNPEKAIDIFRKENIDIVVSDIRMQRMNGIQLLEKLKHIDPLINIILITAYDKDSILLLEALRHGAFDFLEKVEDIDLLMNVIERGIDDREIKLNYSYYKNKDINKQTKDMIGNSKSIVEIKDTINNIAKTSTTVLITGETGTGKEIVARMIHNISRRKDNNFVSINCAAINSNLLESELFGYKKGAFTGAYTNKDGLFKIANKGTIFLDEIAEMDMAMQVKLLRVLQEKEITPVGSVENIPIDVRIIAATNKNIDEEVKKKLFRMDLFYRLNVIRIDIPPLRKRKEDIKEIFNYYINMYSLKYNKRIEKIENNVYSKLINYNWPGNVRELINIVERIIVVNKNKIIKANDIPLKNIKSNSRDDYTVMPLEYIIKNTIYKALDEAGGDRKIAARMLEIDLSTLYRKLKKYEDQ